MKELTFPDFLGIGAQRAGTTWLTVNLRQHPDIWMPYRKELHYFDRSPAYSSPSHLACANPLFRLVGWQSQHRHYRQQLQEGFFQNMKRFDQPYTLQELRWNLKYYFGWYGDRWYASLFEQGKDRVKGEITPAYSLLEPADVEHISKIMPAVKIIFLLRNPIDRICSSLIYRLQFKQKGLQLSSLSLAEIEQRVNQAGNESRTDYLNTLSLWQQYFPKHQFFIGFYEEVQDKPKDLLLRLFEFLGVESSEDFIFDSAFYSVNATFPQNESLTGRKDYEIPMKLQVYLAKKYLPQLEELSSALGGYAKVWLQDAQSLLENSESSTTSPVD